MMPKSETNFFKGKQRHKTVADFSVFGQEPLNNSERSSADDLFKDS